MFLQFLEKLQENNSSESTTDQTAKSLKCDEYACSSETNKTDINHVMWRTDNEGWSVNGANML